MEPYQIIIITILVIISIVIGMSVRVVPENHVYVVERLGAYNRMLEPGLHYIQPLIDRIVNKVSLDEQTLKVNVYSKEIIVKYKVSDVKIYTYGVSNAKKALTSIIKYAIENNEIDYRDILQEKANCFGVLLNDITVK